MASLTTLTVACATTSEEAGASSAEAVTAKTHADAGDDTTTTEADAGPFSAECKATLDAAFPGEDEYQWKPVKQSKKVVACCSEAFEDDRFGEGHRWACCVAYDEVDAHGQPLTVAGQGHGMACTPWGPPVPPSMKRSRKASPARRDMNVALTTHFGLAREIAA